MSKFAFIAGPMRLPFLILTPACVLIGVSTAYFDQGSINNIFALLALIGGLAAHISVNSFNEYFDFKSGLDSHTQRTPFSGGSGTLPEHPEAAVFALSTAIISFFVIVLLGVYFIWIYDFSILPLGLLGLIVIVAYTPLFTRNPIICLIAPGLGFGPLMVMGTHFVLTGGYTWVSFLSSLIPFFLVANLLLLNQYPDVEADRDIGRKHFPIVLGKKMSSVIYSLFLLFTYLVVIYGVYIAIFPLWTLIALSTVIISIPLSIGVFKNNENTSKLIPFMGLNVVVNIVTPVLFALGFFIAG